MQQYEDADVIVVGSGLAGLTAALTAADQGAQALLVTAGSALAGSSWWAQGGIAAAIGHGDRPSYHAADTLAVGAALNDRHAVQVLVREGARAVNGLLRDGVAFDGGPDEPDLGLEAGHSHRRILHAGGGATGGMVSAALLERVLHHANIRLADETPVDGLVQEAGRVVGVMGNGTVYRGRGVVLATGGYAGLWGRSTNPLENRGVGLALAWRAGATLADLEFVQFHPTALDLPGAPAFLLSEALRGEGGRLVDAQDRSVINPLQARDVVARAIFRYRQEHGPVYLSLRHLDPIFIKSLFASIARQLQTWGLDLARDLLPIAPAAHYCMGGIRSDVAGRTDLPGLYVAGEAACTGAQGANRLASNSLLECLVFGQRAAIAALTDAPTRHAHWATRAISYQPSAISDDHAAGDKGSGIRDQGSAANTQYAIHDPHSSFLIPHSSSLGARLDADLGVERDGARLAALVADLQAPGAETAPDVIIAGLAARAAWLRAESRGAHYRTDAPAANPAWRGHIHWRRDAAPRFEEVTTH